KGLAYGVHALFEGELQTLTVALCECADSKVDARKVQPLARTQFAAHSDHARDIGSAHFRDFELNITVIKREHVTALHHLWQTCEADGDTLLVANDILRGERETVGGLQLDRFHTELANAHLRAGQIGHDRHGPACSLGRRTYVLDVLSVRLE